MVFKPVDINDFINSALAPSVSGAGGGFNEGRFRLPVPVPGANTPEQPSLEDIIAAALRRQSEGEALASSPPDFGLDGQQVGATDPIDPQGAKDVAEAAWNSWALQNPAEAEKGLFTVMGELGATLLPFGMNRRMAIETKREGLSNAMQSTGDMAAKLALQQQVRESMSNTSKSIGQRVAAVLAPDYVTDSDARSGGSPRGFSLSGSGANGEAFAPSGPSMDIARVLAGIAPQGPASTAGFEENLAIAPRARGEVLGAPGPRPRVPPALLRVPPPPQNVHQQSFIDFDPGDYDIGGGSFSGADIDAAIDAGVVI